MDRKEQNKQALRDLKGLGIFVLLLFTAVIITIVGAALPAEDSDEVRITTCLALLLAGYCYYRIKLKVSKILVGVISILSAFVVDWYELGKYLDPRDHSPGGERWIFLFGGIAVMAHGIKQIADARSERDPED